MRTNFYHLSIHLLAPTPVRFGKIMNIIHVVNIENENEFFFRHITLEKFSTCKKYQIKTKPNIYCTHAHATCNNFGKWNVVNVNDFSHTPIVHFMIDIGTRSI